MVAILVCPLKTYLRSLILRAMSFLSMSNEFKTSLGEAEGSKSSTVFALAMKGILQVLTSRIISSFILAVLCFSETEIYPCGSIWVSF